MRIDIVLLDGTDGLGFRLHYDPLEHSSVFFSKGRTSRAEHCQTLAFTKWAKGASGMNVMEGLQGFGAGYDGLRQMALQSEKKLSTAN